MIEQFGVLHLIDGGFKQAPWNFPINHAHKKQRISVAHHHHEMSTRFIDNKIIELLSCTKANQLVFITDEIEVPLYKLEWPVPVVIYNVSSLAPKGIKPPQKCFVKHIPYVSLCDNWTEVLVKSGYRGDRPSIWSVQGLDLNEADMQCLLEAVSMHAMKDSYFVGEISSNELSEINALRRRFLSCGLDVERVPNEDISSSKHVFFIAKQLRLSLEQVCKGLEEIEIAEEVEEDGFEDW